MAGTFSQYPEAIDVLNRLADGVGNLDANTLNVLIDSARQLEVTLGADPIGNARPAGSASDWASLTTIQGWLQRFFRMEFGTFEIELPLAAGASAWTTDFTVFYKNAQRFEKESAGAAANIPHFVGVTFDGIQGPNGESIGGSIAYQPFAHPNLYYNSSTNEILGFTLRNNDSWGEATKYRDTTISGKYWAFEPKYHS